MPTKNSPAGIPDGLVDTGYTNEEFTAPATPSGKTKTEIHYPSFSLQGVAAKELLNILPDIDTDFAAIVVLNVHSKQGPTDNDADYDDERIELQVKALMPHSEQEISDVEQVMAGFKEAVTHAPKGQAVGAVEEEAAEGE